MSDVPRISCQGVSKQFRIPVNDQFSLRGRLLHPFSNRSVRRFDALDDVSFEVHDGEFFGIVGRNGSGKSTLLKILGGIYSVDTGRLDIDGTLAPFIELGVGFNFELSGRDNVYLNGALLGLSRPQLRERYEHIVRFAELEEFMDLKLANFSSGMQVRLAFAIAVESDADILLVDEVLAVGDERFQRKCFDVFRQRKAAGKTVVFVSHDMGAVQEFCDRVLLLDNGVVVECADARTVAQTYHRLNVPDARGVDGSYDTGWIRTLDIEPGGVGDDDIPKIEPGSHVRLSMTVKAIRSLERPSYGFVVADRHGRTILASNTAYREPGAARLEAGSRVEVSFEFTSVLGPGEYYVSATLEDEDATDAIDLRHDVLQFVVEQGTTTGAIIELPHNVTVTTVDEVSEPGR